MSTRTLTRDLLEWFDKNGRDLPWREKGGAHSDAYAVWISEIMLQQTTVKTVIPYFHKWMKRFPTVRSLARAPLEEILLMWQGLGYYTRAKKIYECAQVLVQQYDGQFPPSKKELLKLPGIGPYTSSSIMAFAFNKPETVIDGNVVRVLARLDGIEEPVTPPDFEARASELTSQERPADYASAIMDLGATVCLPANPECLFCPWQKECKAFHMGLTDKIPSIKKPKKLFKRGNVFWIENDKGEVLLRKREGKGLLSGLTEFPWNEDETFPFEADWEKGGVVSHTFTHFHLDLTLYKTRLAAEKELPENVGGFFTRTEDFNNYPFSTLMKKVIKQATGKKSSPREKGHGGEPVQKLFS